MAYSKTAGAGIIFHRFPGFVTIRQEWITRCSSKTTFNPDSSRMCSCYFTIEDYERDLKNELLGSPLKRILKKTAIPILELAEIQENYDAGQTQDHSEKLLEVV
ncbi:unnamed protein product [Phaedon cochleariae]|uniref:THAP-type domain-containing protein n=1 Tax=Phaedon cochleariae TaxID=80249 RepID=A0A9N9S917_PHACE|nr:unnamed protein product [Phaedon cochleariae]